MDAEELGFHLPATAAAELIRTKQLSRSNTCGRCSSGSRRLEPQDQRLRASGADQAMEAAKRAEAALMRGDRIGRLHGVPVTIKDLADTKDMPTQSGSLIFAGHQPTEDTPIVPRLQDEGAIILGKTTTSEFGWTGVSRSPLTGITHNPWKHGYNAGASSAGAGAAAAAGFGPLHQGSDGAGSIRMPSHFCGVFGLKPSFGRVPVLSGQHRRSDVAYRADDPHRGGRRADAGGDVRAAPARLHDVGGLAGGLLRRLHEGIKGKRIAYSPDLGVARVDPDVAALVQAAAARFTELGAHVEEVPTPWAAPGRS